MVLFSKGTMLYNLWILGFSINQCSMISLPSSFQTLTQGLITVKRPNHPTQPSLAWTSSQSEVSSLHCLFSPSTVAGLHLLYHLNSVAEEDGVRKCWVRTNDLSYLAAEMKRLALCEECGECYGSLGFPAELIRGWQDFLWLSPSFSEHLRSNKGEKH